MGLWGKETKKCNFSTVNDSKHLQKKIEALCTHYLAHSFDFTEKVYTSKKGQFLSNFLENTSFRHYYIAILFSSTIKDKHKLIFKIYVGQTLVTF